MAKNWLFLKYFITEGPCLLHSTNGELLRSLRTPAGSLHPLLVKISNDRYITINYSSNDRSQLATFTINGRFLKEVGIDDDVGVCNTFSKYFLSFAGSAGELF